MKLLDLSLPLPTENLALDEALLDEREANGGEAVLRFWETTTPFVVLGYVCKVDDDVNIEECRQRSVPILRRHSGGGTVLQASGVLNYALILPIEYGTPTENLATTNAFVMQKTRDALQALAGDEISIRGITDLALGHLKFCGNAQRRRRKWLLFHGAFLLDCDLHLMSAVLKLPPRQPEYRAGRGHVDFVTNLHLPNEQVKEALRTVWQANDELLSWPQEAAAKLVAEKYSRDEWNWKF
ncbi:MAG TPA: biotin/lipoate A/B protein ligase family protein [Abditibacteriaceae bacterium]|jgi:lipoate-protein ligase A